METTSERFLTWSLALLAILAVGAVLKIASGVMDSIWILWACSAARNPWSFPGLKNHLNFSPLDGRKGETCPMFLNVSRQVFWWRRPPLTAGQAVLGSDISTRLWIGAGMWLPPTKGRWWSISGT